jgi:hypothetical protein
MFRDFPKKGWYEHDGFYRRGMPLFCFLFHVGVEKEAVVSWFTGEAVFVQISADSLSEVLSESSPEG